MRNIISKEISFENVLKIVEYRVYAFLVEMLSLSNYFC